MRIDSGSPGGCIAGALRVSAAAVGPLPGAWGRLSLPQKTLGEGFGQPSFARAAGGAWQWWNFGIARFDVAVYNASAAPS
jgi:hypothetical protein